MQQRVAANSALSCYSAELQLEVVLHVRRGGTQGGSSEGGVGGSACPLGVLRVPIHVRMSMRQQHDWLQIDRLPAASQRLVVTQEPRVYLSFVHGPPSALVVTLVHLLNQLHLLPSQGVGQAAKYHRIEEANTSEHIAPSHSTGPQLIVIGLLPADCPDLLIVPASREREDSDSEAETG